MSPIFFSKHTAKKQQGLSLIELLVAMFITTIIFAGVINTFLTTKQSYVFSEQMSYMQENARFAMDSISRDLRLAGYYGGCAVKGSAQAVAITVNNQPNFVGINPVEGFEVGGHPAEYSANVRVAVSSPDSIIVRYSTSEGNLSVNSHVPPVVTVNANHGFDAGKVVVLAEADCSQLAITSAAVAGTNQITHALGNNCTSGLYGDFDCTDTSAADLVTAYPANSTLSEFVAKAYYIGRSSADDTMPALFVQNLNDTGGLTAEELVPGVEDLQIVYGVDTNPTTSDGNINRYVNNITTDTADAGSGWVGWGRVLAVRIQLVVVSRDPVLLTTTSQTPIPGGTTYDDRFMRQLVTTTVQMRNAVLVSNQ